MKKQSEAKKKKETKRKKEHGHGERARLTTQQMVRKDPGGSHGEGGKCFETATNPIYLSYTAMQNRICCLIFQDENIQVQVNLILLNLS